MRMPDAASAIGAVGGQFDLLRCGEPLVGPGPSHGGGGGRGALGEGGRRIAADLTEGRTDGVAD